MAKLALLCYSKLELETSSPSKTRHISILVGNKNFKGIIFILTYLISVNFFKCKSFESYLKQFILEIELKASNIDLWRPYTAQKTFEKLCVTLGESTN